MNFSGKEGHTDIQPSTRPGIEPGNLHLSTAYLPLKQGRGLNLGTTVGGRDLTSVSSDKFVQQDDTPQGTQQHNTQIQDPVFQGRVSDS